MRAIEEGTLGLTGAFVDEMYFCLDCQACQTACPAGVQYGELVEHARVLIDEQGKTPFLLKLTKRLVLDGMLASKRRTKMVARLGRLYQRSGIRESVERSGILRVFSERLHAKHAMLPVVSEKFYDESVPDVVPAIGGVRGRVVLLTGCIMNVAMVEIHRDTVRVLTANGFDVLIPKQQGCCGSLHGHNGSLRAAKLLARTNIDVFARLDADAIITNSAGCSAFMKQYGTILADDDEYASRAQAVTAMVRDATEFLVEVGFRPPTRTIEARVTYHDACHLAHTQKISSQPREIIRAIPGIQFVELPESMWCCGSAGIYNVTRYDDSMQFLARKLKNLASTNAQIILTANPGCHLQLQHGIREGNLPVEVLHPISLLARSY
jgi:glycolate oxidase iron-sulfur subunit